MLWTSYCNLCSLNSIFAIFRGYLGNHNYKGGGQFYFNLQIVVQFQCHLPCGYENLWKSLWFHLMQTDHNLCQNLCFDQFLTFTIWGTKVESPPKWYKRLKFLDSDSDKKALWSTFAISSVLMCQWAKIYASNWHYNSHGINKCFSIM